MLTVDERREALGIARRAVEAAAGIVPSGAAEPMSPPTSVFAEPRGVFVTLREYPSDRLRGCIGYVLPVFPLGHALERAAASAALDDPRFRPIRADELSALTVEVSVLTVPEPIPGGDPDAIAAAVRVGRDGLIVESSRRSGLLLPQVAPEQGWSAEEFLAGTCEKAGLPPTAWRSPGVVIRRFQAEVFREGSPEGELVDEPAVTEGDARSARRS